MDPIKKRKIDDQNGVVDGNPNSFTPHMQLTPDDARKILEPFTHDQLLEIVQNALLRHPDVLDSVRSVSDRDVTQRKLFIRGLGSETTTEKLRALFASYGELDEAVVIHDKVTGKSKGYGFITFKHIDGAMMALKEPSKNIDGRMTVTQLAAAGTSSGGGGGGSVGGGSSGVDVSSRKIFVGNVPYDMQTERLLQHFLMYGEIEEGPLGFDKATGKSKGFALFVYKTAEAARAALVDPIKNIDGHTFNCKLASEGKRGKPPGAPAGVGAVGQMGVTGGNQRNGDGSVASMPGWQYGGPGGGQYGGMSGGSGPGVGGPGVPPIGNQASGSNLGFGGGYNTGLGGTHGGSSHFGGPTGYNGRGGSGVGLDSSGGALGGIGSGLGGGGGGGMGGVGRGSSLYGYPPSSTGMGSGDYPHSGPYIYSSSGYQGQHNQPVGASPAPRVPSGGVYQGMPRYY